MSELFPTPDKPDPRIHFCATCRAPNAPCGMAGMFFCTRCVPPDWYPAKDGGAE